MADKISIQFLPGCPNRQLAEDRVREALDRLSGRRPAVVLEEIADEEQALRVGFHGSPTVLVDGVDPFAGPDAEVAFSCRVYLTPSGADGAPSVDQLYEAVTATSD